MKKNLLNLLSISVLAVFIFMAFATSEAIDIGAFDLMVDRSGDTLTITNKDDTKIRDLTFSLTIADTLTNSAGNDTISVKVYSVNPGSIDANASIQMAFSDFSNDNETATNPNHPFLFIATGKCDDHSSCFFEQEVE